MNLPILPLALHVLPREGSEIRVSVDGLIDARGLKALVAVEKRGRELASELEDLRFALMDYASENGAKIVVLLLEPAPYVGCKTIRFSSSGVKPVCQAYDSAELEPIGELGVGSDGAVSVDTVRVDHHALQVA